ncbi:hypothetical protein OIV83_003302 [Microbotryomycetes sp. JL201]|nr:hypothetical protein OIV83_003302 [Microbotryomycetes sp. JL201]
MQHQRVPYIDADHQAQEACFMCDLDATTSSPLLERMPPKLTKPLLTMASMQTLTTLSLIGGAVPSGLVVACLGPGTVLRKQLVKLRFAPTCCFSGAWEWVLQAHLFLPDDNGCPRANSFDAYRKARPPFPSVRPRRQSCADDIRRRAADYGIRAARDESIPPAAWPSRFESLQELTMTLRLVDNNDLRIVLASTLFPRLRKLRCFCHQDTVYPLTSSDVDLVRRAVSSWVLADHKAVDDSIVKPLFWDSTRRPVKLASQGPTMSLCRDDESRRLDEWTYMSPEAVSAYDQHSQVNRLGQTLELDVLDVGECFPLPMPLPS